MSKQELIDALKSEQTMAEYLEVRDDSEIISDIRSVIPPGLTKRDYFAAAALTGLLAYSHYNDSWGDYHNNSSPSGVASRCLEYADALIAASKTGGPEHG